MDRAALKMAAAGLAVASVALPSALGIGGSGAPRSDPVAPSPTAYPGGPPPGSFRARIEGLGFRRAPDGASVRLPQASVIRYTREDGAAVTAELTERIGIRVCAVGGRLLDVRRDRILIARGQRLLDIPRPCPSRAETIAHFGRLLGEARTRATFVDCARYSPNGRWIAVTVHTHRSGADPCAAGGQVWAGRTDGARWGLLRDQATNAIWIDRDRVAILPTTPTGDPFAIDIHTGRTALLTLPFAALGAIAPSGDRAVYLARSYGGERRGRILTEQSLRIGHLRSGSTASLDPIDQRLHERPRLASIWSPDGNHVMLGGTIYRRDGVLVEQVPAGWRRRGWLDHQRVWIAARRGFSILQLNLGRARVERSYVHIVPPGARAVHAIVPRATIPEAPGSGALASRIERRSLDLVSFRMPPSWTVHRCRCGPRPYRSATALLDGTGGRYNLSWTVSFLVTDDDLDRATSRITKAHTSQRYDRLASSGTVRLGGVDFRRLSFSHYEGSTLIYLGRARGRTIVIQVDPEAADGDPSTAVVLDTLRLS